jgi:hypothetical protein
MNHKESYEKFEKSEESDKKAPFRVRFNQPETKSKEAMKQKRLMSLGIQKEEKKVTFCFW